MDGTTIVNQDYIDSLIAEVASLRTEVTRLRADRELADYLLRTVPVPDYRAEYAIWQVNVEDYLETI